MPMYTYRFEDGTTTDVFQRVADAPLVEIDGRPCEKIFAMPFGQTRYGKGNGTRPIEMLSIALDNEDEITAFRKRNPGVEIEGDRRKRNFGVPIAKSRQEKLRILKNEGFVETN